MALFFSSHCILFSLFNFSGGSFSSFFRSGFLSDFILRVDLHSSDTAECLAVQEEEDLERSPAGISANR